MPWAIGDKDAQVEGDGGHKSIEPSLGTMQDFRNYVREAKRRGIRLAADALAFQCSPDHSYVHEHPEWFKKRPDGSIRYAENPPKKYEDVYPLNFSTPTTPKTEECTALKHYHDNNISKAKEHFQSKLIVKSPGALT